MEEILNIQNKIVPELLQILEKRYDILKNISYRQPVGRRTLANSLSLSERVVRSEIDILKNQNLVEINPLGMTITTEGIEIVAKLEKLIYNLKGFSEMAEHIKEYLNIKCVIVVSGDMEHDPTVIKEMGKIFSNYIKNIITDDSIIALTGGTTIRDLIRNFTCSNTYKNVLVLPARGGIGRTVEVQANTIAADFAKKLKATYKLLHVPDNLSDSALKTLLEEKDVKETVNNIKNANIIIYGVGNAEEMASRRGLLEEDLEILRKNHSVGEAFGCYFNKEGNIVYATQTIGINACIVEKAKHLIAIAGGKNKAQAILATQKNHSHSVLITDESAAIEMVRLISENKNA